MRDIIDNWPSALVLILLAAIAWRAYVSPEHTASVCLDDRSLSAISRRLHDVERQLEGAMIVPPARLGPPTRGE